MLQPTAVCSKVSARAPLTANPSPPPFPHRDSSSWPLLRVARLAPAPLPPPSTPPQTARTHCWPAPATSSLTPPRLYVRNLPDKLAKQDLKRSLYMLFATYGVLLDIVALKTTKMRGQAHVVFRDIDTSTQAMRALQGFTFFGKDMVRLLPLQLPQATVTELSHSRLRMPRQSPIQ